MATFYIDPESGSDSNAGTSFALAWKTITSGATSGRIAAGDTIRIKASPDPTLVGSATWTNYNDTITLASAVTQLVDDGETAWTAATNVTTTASGTRKSGSFSASAALGASFTTGKAAYKTLGSTLNLSTYQQLSFWLQSSGNASQIAAGSLQLALCSDTTGDVPVASLNIPIIGFAGAWHPYVVDFGSALPSNVNSIALYVVTKPGNYTFLLDNINAVLAPSNAASLSVKSLVSKNNGPNGTYAANEAWWAIRSINGTTIKLDVGAQSANTTMRGYVGTSETVNLYKREPMNQLDPTATNGATIGGIQKGGNNIGTYITYSGGWNRTDMSTQTGDTYFDGVNATGFGLMNGTSAIVGVKIEHIHLVRYDIGFYVSNTQTDWNYTNCSAINMLRQGYNPLLNKSTYTNCYAVACQSNAFQISTCSNLSFSGCVIYSCNSTAIQTSSVSSAWYNTTVKNCAGFALDPTRSLNYFYTGISDNNSSGSLNNVGGYGNYFYNWVFNEATIWPSNPSLAAWGCEWNIYSGNHNGVVGAHRVMGDGMLIQTDTGTDRHTASGVAWKLSPLNSNRATSVNPVSLSLAKIMCKASHAATVSVWTKRDNTGLGSRLICKGGQIAGVASDVIASGSALANTYEQLTITFTPTADGVVEILGQCWGGTTFNCWFDDMSIS